jgi:hypothetical protein
MKSDRLLLGFWRRGTTRKHWTLCVLAKRDYKIPLLSHRALLMEVFMVFLLFRFRREVFVSRSDPPTSGGLETGYGIASVFTPPDKSGKGYAKHMMRLLHWVLARPDARASQFPEAWGEAPASVEGFMNASVSVLYSDVGTDFYASCGFLPGTHDGWTVAPRAATSWKVSAGSQTRLDMQ